MWWTHLSVLLWLRRSTQCSCSDWTGSPPHQKTTAWYWLLTGRRRTNEHTGRHWNKVCRTVLVLWPWRETACIIIHDSKMVKHTFICRLGERFPCGPVGPDLPPSQPLSAHLLDGILCILVAPWKVLMLQMLTTKYNDNIKRSTMKKRQTMGFVCLFSFLPWHFVPGQLCCTIMERCLSYPFVEEGDKAIAFRFSRGHVFHHPAISAGRKESSGSFSVSACMQTGEPWTCRVTHFI